MNTLEFHVWGSKAGDLDHADRLVFDLDPGEGVPWKRMKDAALELRGRLQDFKLQSFLRTWCCGQQGPAPGSAAQARRRLGRRQHAFAQALAASLAQQQPDRYLAVASKARREDKIFIDYLRNGRGNTAVASYSLRNRPGAPIAAPLGWDELGRLRGPQQYGYANIRRRLARLEVDPLGWDRGACASGCPAPLAGNAWRVEALIALDLGRTAWHAPRTLRCRRRRTFNRQQTPALCRFHKARRQHENLGSDDQEPRRNQGRRQRARRRACRLAEKEVGALPVEQDDRLLGMITDRDIVVRVVAGGHDPAKTSVEDVVSREPKYCFEDEDVSHVASNMDKLMVRRLPVMDRNKRLVGIVSIEDIRPRKH